MTYCEGMAGRGMSGVRGLYQDVTVEMTGYVAV